VIGGGAIEEAQVGDKTEMDDDYNSILDEVSSPCFQQKLKDRFPFLCEYGLRRYPKSEPTPVSAKHVATAVLFLRQFKPVKHGAFSSYYLKHAAEKWGGSVGLSYYITNGALLAAAFFLGRSIEPHRGSWFPPSPNADIGISKRDFRRITGAY
jgi:hypothetical protein